MRRRQPKSRIARRTSRRQNDQRGVVIVLVAVVMLFVVGAMAALSIDVVTLYTARSEAQLAADAAALAGARVLANSGMTSDPTADTDGVMAAAQDLASPIAVQVAKSNSVGGRNLNAGEVAVSFSGSATNPCVTSSAVGNPCITVKVRRTDLPTFFSRIWGRTQLAVAATATAEAYNPSTVGITPTKPRVAPMCVKPWLLPNMDPKAGGTTIFDKTTGTITNADLLGWVTGGPTQLRNNCQTGASPPGTPTDCSAKLPAPWKYYPATTDPTTGDFPAPSASSVVCTGCTGFNSYQLSVAGCVQPPITCNKIVNIDQTATVTDAVTAPAVIGLTHSNASEGDRVDPTAPNGGPFEFIAGNDDPVVLSGAVTSGTEIMVTDSLVTVPVVNLDSTATLPLPGFPAVQVIGYVQLFLSPNGSLLPPDDTIHTKVINMVGCGTGGATGAAILGNGASPVAVRLISGS